MLRALAAFPIVPAAESSKNVCIISLALKTRRLRLYREDHFGRKFSSMFAMAASHRGRKNIFFRKFDQMFGKITEEYTGMVTFLVRNIPVMLRIWAIAIGGTADRPELLPARSNTFLFKYDPYCLSSRQ